MKTLALVVPCKNEAKRLDVAAFLEAVGKWPWLSFLFVDDGSTDSTAETLAHLSNLSCAMHAIHLPETCGKSHAVRAGVLHLGRISKTDCIGFWDADLATPLSEIPAFMRYFEENPAMSAVIGSRWARLGGRIRRAKMRGLGGALTRLLARRALGVEIYDTQCGAKIFKRETALELFRQPFRSRWLFDIELLARMGRRRLLRNVCEHPLSFWFDAPGSKVGLGAIKELLHFALRTNFYLPLQDAKK